jgi:hypothetical protein
MERKAIKRWVHSVLDHKSAADVLDAVAQDRQIGVQTIVEDMSRLRLLDHTIKRGGNLQKKQNSR